ncbi:MAG: ABC transporter ATP-binding protein [Verrucomicrobiae bacterium]|nr:ABC transporter ATP-binding protein [Verrucomicrobiae bacterium]
MNSETETVTQTVKAETSPLIEVRDLHKTYSGGKDALNGASLTVQPGQVYGLVGANGAGKTTLIKILLGLLRSKQGTAHLFGKPFGKSSPAERARVASVSQEHSAYPSMTLAELCYYLSGFYHLWDQTFADHLRGRFELPADTPLGQLSGGERRRASILLALATRAQVLIMDEPAANLDPMARRTLLEELAGVLADREGTTVLFSTHILSDLERIADTIGILKKGVITHESSVEDLTSNLRKVQVIFTETAMPDAFQLPGQLGTPTREGNVYTATARVPTDDFKNLRDRPGVRIQLFPVSLEDALIELMESGKVKGGSGDEV